MTAGKVYVCSRFRVKGCKGRAYEFMLGHLPAVGRHIRDMRLRAWYWTRTPRQGPLVTQDWSTYKVVGSLTSIQRPSLVWILRGFSRVLPSAAPSPIPWATMALSRASSSCHLTSRAIFFLLKRICVMASSTVLPAIWRDRNISFLVLVGRSVLALVCCFSVSRTRCSRVSGLSPFRTICITFFLRKRTRHRGSGFSARSMCSFTFVPALAVGLLRCPGCCSSSCSSSCFCTLSVSLISSSKMEDPCVRCRFFSAMICSRSRRESSWAKGELTLGLAPQLNQALRRCVLGCRYCRCNEGLPAVARAAIMI